MEGIGAEAASLAGHLKLANLCWIYDNNRITIEGATSLAFSEDVPARFAGYGWAVQHVTDANDLGALRAAFEAFRAPRPTADADRRRQCHRLRGAAQAGHALRARRTAGRGRGEGDQAVLRLAGDAKFLVRTRWRARPGRDGRARRGARREWEQLFARYAAQYPQQAEQLNHMQRRTLPEGWDTDIPTFPADAKGVAGRDANAAVLNAVARRVPWLIGGSADLAPSNKSRLTFEGAGDFSVENRAGRNLHFGVREHAAAAVSNGLALSKLRAYQAGFLIFSDFQRGALRLSALMELPLIHIYTHDSIGVGEDGPTHQPIEHLASIRAMPGVIDLRPADANEVAQAWRVLMPIRHEPVALMLSRQALPTLDRSRYGSAAGVAKGAYVLADPPEGEPGGHPDRHRQRGGHDRRRLRATDRGRDQGAGGVHAVDGAVRQAAPGVPRPGAAAIGDRTGVGGEGHHVRLGPLGRPDRGDHRDEHLRGVRAAESSAGQVRLHPRAHRGHRARPARPGLRHRRACGHPRNGGVVTGPDTPRLDPGRRRGTHDRGGSVRCRSRYRPCSRAQLTAAAERAG